MALANLSATGHARLDHRFILFDNFVVEALKYHDAHTFGGKDFDPYFNHSSTPAIIGTVTAAFGFDNTSTNATNLDEYILLLKENAIKQGYDTLIRLPPYTANFEADHPYSGLSYGFMKGPDNEAIQIVHVGGKFRDILYQAMIISGAMSTMFNDTNPYSYGDMDDFCPYATFNENYITTTASATSQIGGGECSSSSSSTTNEYNSESFNYENDDNDTMKVTSYTSLAFILLSLVIICFATFIIVMVDRRLRAIEGVISGKFTEMRGTTNTMHDR